MRANSDPLNRGSPAPKSVPVEEVTCPESPAGASTAVGTLDAAGRAVVALPGWGRRSTLAPSTIIAISPTITTTTPIPM